MGKQEINVLGALETKIMEIIWKLEQASVRDVLNHIKSKKKPAYTTIMTVMSRLHNKGILKRECKNEAYIYKPKQNKQNFKVTSSKKIIQSLIHQFGEEIAVAGFIDTLETLNSKKSKELREKLNKLIK